MRKKLDKEITLDTIVQRDPQQEFSKIDDEVVMLSLKNGKYYALNEVASSIWGLIENKKKVADIVQSLTEEYDISLNACQNETIEYLNDLFSKELVFIA